MTAQQNYHKGLSEKEFAGLKRERAPDGSYIKRLTMKSTPPAETTLEALPTPVQALICLFRENNLQLTDRNSFLLELIQDALLAPTEQYSEPKPVSRVTESQNRCNRILHNQQLPHPRECVQCGSGPCPWRLK